MTTLICPSEFGTYNGKAYLEFPEHMLAKNGGYYTTKQGCELDLCLVDEIKSLWSKGISTYGSCCGHGINNGMINVDEKDLDTMLELGYELCEVEDGYYPITFIPKSKHSKIWNMKEID